MIEVKRYPDQIYPLVVVSDSQPKVPRTDRTFHEYAEYFGYSLDGKELKGKTILDLGAGDSTFAQEAKKRFGTNVVRLDISYDTLKPLDTHNAVVGRMEELPFAANTFDEVLASYSLFWLDGLQEKTALEEMVRVCKEAGLIKVYPAMRLTEDKRVYKNLVYSNSRLSMTKPSSLVDQAKLINDARKGFGFHYENRITLVNLLNSRI